MSLLVDTDILIWYMRGNPRARRFLDIHEGFRLSAVTYMELVQGMRNKREFSALRGFMRARAIPVLPIEGGISSRAISYVEEHYLSHSVRVADALVAATAVEHGLALATGNLKHYRPISGLDLVPFSADD